MQTHNQSTKHEYEPIVTQPKSIHPIANDDTPTPVGCGEQVDREGEELVRLARKLRHEDPVTHEPGCHPLGAGLGAVVGGASIGATSGALLGPAGAVVGTVLGAVVGGLAGKSIEERIDPTVELVFWRGAYHTRHYYKPDRPFEHYELAYRLGVESFDENHSRTFAEAEPAMKRKWEDLQVWEDEGGAPPMSWEEARAAAQDSYDRLRKERPR